jgi:hypothetical protein
VKKSRGNRPSGEGESLRLPIGNVRRGIGATTTGGTRSKPNPRARKHGSLPGRTSLETLARPPRQRTRDRYRQSDDRSNRRLRRRPLPQRVDDIPPSGPPLADRRPDCLEADADRPSGVQCFRARYAEPVHFGAQLGVRRVSRFKALYGKAKGRALDGTSLPESLVADRTMAFVPMRDQSLEYVLMTSNALIRSGKGNRGDKGPRSVLSGTQEAASRVGRESRRGGTLRWSNVASPSTRSASQ